MKTIALFMLITLNVAVLGIGSVLAGQVGTLNDFQAGTPAVAQDVDDNFSDIKKEVNDNNARITTNTTGISANATAIQGKQNRVTGTCNPGQSIRVIKADGSVECEVDDTSPGLQPIAFGFIDLNGSIESSTASVTNSIWNSSLSRYEITISGESYYYTDYVTVVTPEGGTPVIATTASVSGKLIIFLYNTSGGKVQANFQFVTFKP